MKFYSAILLVFIVIIFSCCTSQFSATGTKIARSSLVLAKGNTNSAPRKSMLLPTNTPLAAMQSNADKITGFSTPLSQSKVKVTAINSHPITSLTKEQLKTFAQINYPKTNTSVTGSVPPWPVYEDAAIAASIAFGISLVLLAFSIVVLALITVGLLAAFIGMLTGLSAIKKLKHEATYHGRFLAWLGFLGGAIIIAGALSFMGYILATAKH